MVCLWEHLERYLRLWHTVQCGLDDARQGTRSAKEHTVQLQTVRLIVLLTFSLVAIALTATAQPAGKGYRIGWLSAGSPRSGLDLEAFQQGLRELGYVEGQHFVLEARYAEGRAEQLPDLAAELVQRKVDVIVAGGSAAIGAAQQATPTIPIVMAVAYDPIGKGFVASLAQPGGNITGVSWLGAELLGKRLEILKEAVPQSTRIAVLANPANPAYQPNMDNLTVAARALGLHLHVVEVRRADELDTAFMAMPRVEADALIVLEDSLVLSTLGGRIAEHATTARLPAMYGWRRHVDMGGLMSYGPSMRDMQQRAAIYVDKILKGTPPANLPMEQPTKFELIINLQAAHAIGLTIPPTLLFQADEVLR
jgi:putative ABC transport system substrate-binding protein